MVARSRGDAVNVSDLDKLLDKLALCVANRPAAERLALLQESILDNRLTDEEIRRGYLSVRDSPKPFWPSPGEFLAVARPRVAPSTVHLGEGEAIWAAILDHPERYGPYSPHVGRVYERHLVEKLHGAAAGIAFAAVASRFRGGFDEDGKALQWARKDFLTSYEAARAEHPAPTLTPVERQLPAAPEGRTEAELALPGQVDGGEQEKRFREMVSGGFRAAPAPDFETRKAELSRQAQELSGGAA